MRYKEMHRTTFETDIAMSLDLDGSGRSVIDTGIGFLDHMLTLFASHGRFDLNVRCVGDTNVDAHHSTEDIGIVLGTLFADTLGDKKGITRYGSTVLPMDEALILSAVDFSGRAYLGFSVNMPSTTVGDFDTELVEEFFSAFVRTAACSLHIKMLDGRNTHHVIEGIFKSVARTLRAAVKIDPETASEIPSTKGVL